MSRSKSSSRSRAVFVSLVFACISFRSAAEPVIPPDFPALPLPPAVDSLVGLPQTYAGGRRLYLELITRAAQQAGLPSTVADAVAHVESGYNPGAVGGVGEIGLMQVRPQTAAMLGHSGGVTSLFDPETNIRYGVMYLARAWQLAGGDLCRALMKYRAGWGEEQISPLSAEYCRRAKQHLASIGSPLANGALPPVHEASAPTARSRLVATAAPFAAARSTDAPFAARAPVTARTAAVPPRPPLRAALSPKPDQQASRMRVASVGNVRIAPLPPSDLRKRRMKAQMWAGHETRMRAIMERLNSSQLRIASGV